MESELLPCPFCGGEVRFRNSHVVAEGGYIEHVVFNGHCLYVSGALSAEANEYLIAAWNTRAALAVGGEDDLTPQCALCKGSGKTTRLGFASAGDMDSGNDPHQIEESCRVCRGRGFVYLPADELTDKLRSMCAELAATRAGKKG